MRGAWTWAGLVISAFPSNARTMAGDDAGEDDTRLLLRVASGDTEALGDLYDRHAPLLLAFARRALRDAREAEDILHDVFLEVWTHAGDYDATRASVRSWLFLRMRSRCLDRLRSARHRREHLCADPRAGREVGSERAYVDPGERVGLSRALLELGDDQLRVVMLSYFEGLSSSDIAHELCVPEGTVKSRARAAVAKLRGLVGGTDE